MRTVQDYLNDLKIAEQAIAEARIAAIGKRGILPTRQYPNEAERALIPAKYAQAINPAATGVSLSQEQRFFVAALQDVWIDDSAAGYETLMAFNGMGQNDHNGPTEIGLAVQSGAEPLASFWAFRQAWYKQEMGL